MKNQFKKEGRGGYSAGEKALDSALISKSQGIADKAKSAAIVTGKQIGRAHV